MKDPGDQLERLVSRYLDEECTEEERRQLRAMLKSDADASSFLDEYVDLDRELNVAMKRAMGRPPVRRRVVSGWAQIRRLSGLGVAAALAAAVWYGPALTADRDRDTGGDRRAARSASWFAPPPTGGDVLVDETARFEQPQLRLDKDDRNWIVVPGDRPGEFLVVEVKQSKTRTIPLQDDF